MGSVSLEANETGKYFHLFSWQLLFLTILDSLASIRNKILQSNSLPLETNNYKNEMNQISPLAPSKLNDQVSVKKPSQPKNLTLETTNVFIKPESTNDSSDLNSKEQPPHSPIVSTDNNSMGKLKMLID